MSDRFKIAIGVGALLALVVVFSETAAAPFALVALILGAVLLLYFVVARGALRFIGRSLRGE